MSELLRFKIMKNIDLYFINKNKLIDDKITLLFIKMQKLINLSKLNEMVLKLPKELFNHIDSFIMKDSQMSSPIAALVKKEPTSDDCVHFRHSYIDTWGIKKNSNFIAARECILLKAHLIDTFLNHNNIINYNTVLDPELIYKCIHNLHGEFTESFFIQLAHVICLHR